MKCVPVHIGTYEWGPCYTRRSEDNLGCQFLLSHLCDVVELCYSFLNCICANGSPWIWLSRTSLDRHMPGSAHLRLTSVWPPLSFLATKALPTRWGYSLLSFAWGVHKLLIESMHLYHSFFWNNWETPPPNPTQIRSARATCRQRRRTCHVHSFLRARSYPQICPWRSRWRCRTREVTHHRPGALGREKHRPHLNTSHTTRPLSAQSCRRCLFFVWRPGRGPRSLCIWTYRCLWAAQHRCWELNFSHLQE